VVRLTKRINGGTNGLAHRTELLTKAKGLLTMLELKPTRQA
jgi:predicted chitinase